MEGREYSGERAASEDLGLNQRVAGREDDARKVEAARAAGDAEVISETDPVTEPDLSPKGHRLTGAELAQPGHDALRSKLGPESPVPFSKPVPKDRPLLEPRPTQTDPSTEAGDQA